MSLIFGCVSQLTQQLQTCTKGKFTIMETISIRDFATEKNFVDINKRVAENVNGYKFVTFITNGNVSENIYLTKALNESIATGTVVNKTFMEDKVIAVVENSNGETRYKLASNGDRGRVALDTLL